MFKNIQFIAYDTNTMRTIYQIVDTDFICNGASSAGMRAGCADRVPAIINEYSRRFLNVPQSIALYYLYCQREFKYDPFQLINVHKDYFDKYYKDLKFSEKYYYCTLNQLKKFQYMGYKG